MLCWGLMLLCSFAYMSGLCICEELQSVSIRIKDTPQFFSVPKNLTIYFKVLDIPINVTVLIFQAHSQIENISLSEYPRVLVHSAITGRNIGLSVKLQDTETEKHFWLFNSNLQETKVLVILTGLDSDDPIPGGCNMEFPTEVAPYLRLKADRLQMYLEYQHSNFGSQRNIPHLKCGLSLAYFTYDIYAIFMQENNFEEKEYFEKIKHMSNISFIEQYSSKVELHSLHPDTRYSFLLYPNVGVVYNVIATYKIGDQFKKAVYIPIVTYGCPNSDFSKYGCQVKYTLGNKVFLFLLSMYGFIIAFFGYSFTKLEFFFFGFVESFLIGLIVVGRYLSFSKNETIEMAILSGLFGGTICVILWIWLHNYIIILLMKGLCLGFLISATIVYTPIGNLEIFSNPKNFWTLLSAGTLLFTVLFLAIPQVAAVLASPVIGSYAMILFCDDFAETRLSYIVLNIIKRAVSKNLVFASNNLPFQMKEIIMSVIWILFSLTAVFLWHKKIFNRNRVDLNNLPNYLLASERTKEKFLKHCNYSQPLLGSNTTSYQTFS